MTVIAPLAPYRATVAPDWIDYNGHMNISRYLEVFDLGGDHFFEQIGHGEARRAATGQSYFIAANQLCYLRELMLGDAVRVDAQVLAYDAKRVHVFMRMFHEATGELAATNEFLALNVNLNSRRVTSFVDADCAVLEAVIEVGRATGRPDAAGRAIAIVKPIMEI